MVKMDKFWRTAFFICVVLLIMGAVVAPNAWERRYSFTVASGKAVNGVTAVYSDYFPVGKAMGLGIWTQATSASGTPIVSYTVEYGPRQNAALFTEIEGGSGTLSVGDEQPHGDILLVKPGNWGRIRINGVTGNPADTLVDIVVTHQ